MRRRSHALHGVPVQPHRTIEKPRSTSPMPRNLREVLGELVRACQPAGPPEGTSRADAGPRVRVARAPYDRRMRGPGSAPAGALRATSRPLQTHGLEPTHELIRYQSAASASSEWECSALFEDVALDEQERRPITRDDHRAHGIAELLRTRRSSERLTPPTCPPAGSAPPPRPRRAGRSIAVRACDRTAVRAARIRARSRAAGAAARRRRGRRGRLRASAEGGLGWMWGWCSSTSGQRNGSLG